MSDAEDTLAKIRDEFLFPKMADGTDYIYLAGNSLGLQPKKVREYILQELDDWANLGVEGHLQAKNPWLPYHEPLTPMTARLVGAQENEVVVMNSLTVNLHLLMVSFYQPTVERKKILIDGGAFPSDQYAVKSQIAFHGFDPREDLVVVFPREGEELIRHDDILSTIDREGEDLALVLIGNVNYRTGQSFNMREITKVAHQVGAKVGFDLAHGAGNLHLTLHDDGVDFAAWCSYKYLNAGPGGIAGIYVHERHANDPTLPRFAGWWGHNKKERFAMKPDFDCLPGAEGWQLSNPPILQLAALRASLQLFDEIGMEKLKKKSDALTTYLEGLLRDVPGVSIITPSNVSERGTQLSIRVLNGARELVAALYKKGVICDLREPDIIRVAPAPLYTRFKDVARFVELLKSCL